MKFKGIKSLIPCAALLTGSVLFAALSLNNLTESNAASITVAGDNEVTVYVSGEGVTYNETTKKYEAPTGTSVTISVINEGRIYTGMTIGETPYDEPVVTTTITGDLQLTIETTYSTSDDIGKCFGRAWVLDEAADVIKLANILNGTDFDYTYFPNNNNENPTSLLDIQYGYYVVENSIFLDEEDFEGIGAYGNAFHGCIDFLNNYISVNTSNSGKITNTYGGFFGRVSNGTLTVGSGTEAKDVKQECILRNVNLKGNISYVDTTATSTVSEFSIGGVAGLISGDVVLDNVDSSVSINVQSQSSSVNAGVLFGQLGRRIDAWSNVKATGGYTSVKAITYGKDKNSYVGSLAGRLNGSSVYSYRNEIHNGVYIANSLNESSGHSVASSTIGYISASANTVLKGVVFEDFENIEISTMIENIKGATTSKSIGTFGYGYIDGTYTVNIYPIEFIQSNGSAYTSSIRSSTQSRLSRGNAYAGGLLGYLDNSKVYFHCNNDAEENITFFKTNVYIDAEVTGQGGAYAGGLFAYQPPIVNNTAQKNYTLNEAETTFEVYATQASSCTASSTDMYAGFYSATLNISDETLYLHNLAFTVNNGTLIAQRNVGSTATGNIYAGGLIGAVNCRGDVYSNYANQLMNIDINLNNTKVEALGLSFQSPAASQWVNNVSVGGMFGFVEDCGLLDTFDSTNLVGSGNSVIGGSNLHVSIKVGENNDEYAVRGIQNAVAGGGDHENEGHVGGLIGMLRRGYLDNISVTGTNDSIVRPIITFNSTNSPNTAAVGGVIGENAKGGNCMVSNVLVDNVHIIGKAYSVSNDSDEKYDVYAGGVFGVLAKEWTTSCLVGAKVTNSKIECVGEEKMMTYAGGLTGGAWWAGYTGFYNVEVYGNEILANSISSKAHAGGLSGLIQANNNTNFYIDNAYIVNNYISAVSAEGSAYSAGITSRKRAITGTISNVYINSTITGSGYLDTSGEKFYSSFTCYTTNKGGTNLEDIYSNIFINPENLNIQEGTDSTADTFEEAHDFYYTNSESAYFYQLSDIDPMYISSTAEIYYSVGLSNGGSTILFGGYDVPNDAVLVFSGNVDYLTLDGAILQSNIKYDGADRTVTVNSSLPGTVYVSLQVPYNGTYYELVNQPIIINSGSYDLPTSVQLKNYSVNPAVEITNDNEQVAGYFEKEGLSIDDDTNATTDYYYAIVNVGQTEIGANKNAAQSIQISYSDYKNYNLYTYTGNLEELGDKNANYIVDKNTDCDSRVSTILTNKVSKNDFYFFEFLEFGYDGSSVILTPRSDITERVYIIYEFGIEPGDAYTDSTSLKTVIIEFVPNSLVSVEVKPTSYSGVLGKKGAAYVFAPGDTINFDVVEHHRFYYESSSKGYKFTPKEGTTSGTSTTITGYKGTTPVTLDTNDVTLDSNGTMVIKDTTDTNYDILGCEITVVATSSIDSSTTGEVTIYVDDEITFDFTTSGAYFDSNRKVVFGTDFVFKVTPVAGYGLAPSKLVVTLTTTSGTETYTLDGELKYHTTQDINDSVTFTVNDVDYIFDYSYTAFDGSYTVTIPGELFDTDVSHLAIDVKYGDVYNIVFDKGYEPADESGRYFVYQVRDGDLLDEDLYNAINAVMPFANIGIYGYDFQGFYLVQDGVTINDYGMSFKEYCDLSGTDAKEINGPMQFYARYTYEVIVMAPDIFQVGSELDPGELMPVDGNNSQLVKIIPPDINNGFEFTLTHDGSWHGDIPFEVFIINKSAQINISSETITDEALTKTGVENVTQYVENVDKNLYYLAPKYITGYLVIRVYAEELTFSAGEEEKDSGIHDIYGDSIFTATYSITYNENSPVSIEETISYSNVVTVDGNEVVRGAEFKFTNSDYSDFELPKDTSIRLYRFINHELYDAGVLILDSARSAVYAYDFANMDTKAALTTPNVAKVYAEKYVLVVTLPNHKGLNANYDNVEVKLIATFTEHYNFYDYTNGSFTTKSNSSYESHAKDNFDVYATIPYTVNYNATGANVKLNIGSSVSGVEDLRHSDKFYVWRIQKTDSSMIPNDFTFGTKTPSVKTNGAYYYLATSGEQLSVNGLSGYTISLLEVENVQNPASGVLVWSQAIS